MFTCPRHILLPLLIGPTSSEMMRQGRRGTGELGSSWRSWQILGVQALPPCCLGASGRKQGKDDSRGIHHSVNEQTAPCMSVCDMGQMEDG